MATDVLKKRKGGYMFGGVAQLIIGIFCTIFFLPLFLNCLELETLDGISEILENILGGAYNTVGRFLPLLLIMILFIVNIISLFCRRSLSGTFLKLSFFFFSLFVLFYNLVEISSIVPFLDFLSQLYDSIEPYLNYIYFGIVGAGLLFLVLGFIFRLTKDRNNPNKATVYLFYKVVAFMIIIISFGISLKILPEIIERNYMYSITGLYPSFYYLFASIFMLASAKNRIRTKEKKVKPITVSDNSVPPQQ